MTPEQERKLNEVYEFIQNLKSFSTIPFEVDKAFEDRFSDRFTKLKQATADGLTNAPVSTVSDPTGGTTTDTQARAAINSIIDALQVLGLMQ